MSALKCAEPFWAPAEALTTKVHFVAKLMFVKAVYVPSPLSFALTVGPNMDIVGMFELIATCAPFTGLPVASFTVTRIVSGPCFGGAGANAAVAASFGELAASAQLTLETATMRASGNHLFNKKPFLLSLARKT